MPLLKGGIVLVDYATGAVQRVIPLQYNPETLTRTLQVQGVGPESGPHVDQMRLKGPPIETFKLEAVLDATDQLDAGNPVASASGIQPQLAALETVIYPTSTQLQQANARAQAGTLEIVPMDAPLTLFVWSKERIVPVKITEFSITEEMFDSSLNPIRARVSLGLRVLTIDDIDFSSVAGSIYMTYQQRKEHLAALAPAGTLSAFGISGVLS
jgi:Contractile injection system tube protein